MSSRRVVLKVVVKGNSSRFLKTIQLGWVIHCFGINRAGTDLMYSQGVLHCSICQWWLIVGSVLLKSIDICDIKASSYVINKLIATQVDFRKWICLIIPFYLLDLEGSTLSRSTWRSHFVSPAFRYFGVCLHLIINHIMRKQVFYKCYV